MHMQLKTVSKDIKQNLTKPKQEIYKPILHKWLIS